MRSVATLVVILGVPLMAKTYSVDGIVVAVDAASRTMLVSHRAIAHYMPAMLMPFRAENAAELAPLHPGARIAFDLTVTKAQSVARNIRPTGAPDGDPAAPGKTRHRFGAARLPAHRPAGAHASLRRPSREGRGHRLHLYAVPAARRVPAALRQLRHAAAPVSRSAGESLVLLSVTVDPEFDTPAVLAEYARRWAAGSRLALPHRRRGAAGGIARRNLLGRRRLHRPQFHHLHHRARWTFGRPGRRLELPPRSTRSSDCTPTGESSMKFALLLTLAFAAARPTAEGRRQLHAATELARPHAARQTPARHGNGAPGDHDLQSRGAAVLRPGPGADAFLLGSRGGAQLSAGRRARSRRRPCRSGASRWWPPATGGRVSRSTRSARSSARQWRRPPRARASPRRRPWS